MKSNERNKPQVEGRGHEQFVLRLPVGLRERVKQNADANRRSMNSEMVLHIERGLEQPAQGSKQ